MYIDRGKDSEEQNKRIFDDLYLHKNEIEKDCGDKLEWQRLDDRRASRIRKIYDYAGLDDKDEWDKLQSDMMDTMFHLVRPIERMQPRGHRIIFEALVDRDADRAGRFMHEHLQTLDPEQTAALIQKMQSESFFPQSGSNTRLALSRCIPVL